MKQIEKEIIKHLRKGKRVNISEIARELDLPISTVRDRIRRIEERYVIKRASLMDYTKMGYYANAMLAIRINSKRIEFLDFLKRENCVNSIYHINSSYNYLVELVCKDSLALRNWIEEAKASFNSEILLFQILKTEDKEKFVT